MTQPLTDISSRAWEHPADRMALETLRKVPGFDLVLRKVFGLWSERVIRQATEGSAVRVGPSQYPQLYTLHQEAMATLDCPRDVPLFVSQSPFLNAGAVGWDEPFIVLNSGAVSITDPEQLRFILGHELGHVLSEHVLYKTLLRILIVFGLRVANNPLTGLPLLGIISALSAWDRKAELSSDRAGLLTVQDPDVVAAALLRMAGGVGEGADLAAFREQARQYHQDSDALDAAAQWFAVTGRSHPFAVERLHEIDAWVASGAYEAILGGDYPRREDDPEGPVSAAAEAAKDVSSVAEKLFGRWFPTD